MFNQGSTLAYFIYEPMFDTPIYHYTEGDHKPAQIASSFADFLEANVRQAEQIYKQIYGQGGYYLTIDGEYVTQRYPALKRTSDFLGEIGGVAKKSGLPVFWQIAHDVRRFLLSSHKEATTTMVVETQSPKKPLRFPARAAGLPAVAAMGSRVGRRSPRTHH